MSLKEYDGRGRWRNKTIAFRMSPGEAEQLDIFVKLSGLQKQEYLIKRVLRREIIVNGNPRTYKALRNQLASVSEQLQSISSTGEISDELLEVINQISATLNGFKHEEK